MTAKILPKIGKKRENIRKIGKKEEKSGRFFHFATGYATAVKEKAYQSIVRPQLEYASSLWNPYTTNDKIKIERLGDYRRTSNVTAMLDTLQWDTLQHRRLLAHQATMFYKIRNGTVNMVNISISQRFTLNPRLARGSHHLRFHQVNTNVNSYESSFYPLINPL